MTDDLNIPEHRVLRFLGWTAVAFGALLVGFVLMTVIIDRLDHDTLDHPAPPQGMTHAAPTATATSSVHADQIVVQGEVYDINAPDRPACWMEPSNTPEGYEVILYPRLSMHNDADLGFEVSCPEPDQMGPIVVPCQEDEVVAPAIDPDPNHGLTWACVNAEQYQAGERP
jgi:hypothetical protein